MNQPTSQSGNRATGRLFIITGPSGVGKSTIVREVLKRTGAVFSVSATTRRPREGEQDGREYRFVSRDAFAGMVARDELLEWADVFGEMYGTPAGPVRQAVAQGRPVVLEIDVQGGLQVCRKEPRAVGVLILPPSMAELERRLRGRKTEAEDVLQRRLAKARNEIEAARRSGAYKYSVVNDDLERAIGEVIAILEQEQKTE